MPVPIIRFRVNFDHDEAVGPGKIALLEHIDASGSLSQAARELQMSYRRAWQLLESLNLAFRERVADTSKGGRGGGGATLTPFGRELIRTYRAFERDIQARAERRFLPIAKQRRPEAKPAKTVAVVRLSERRHGGTLGR